MLLAHSAEVPPAPGQHGLQKPLFEAIKRESETIVSVLLSAGANPNDRDPRWSDRVSHSPLMHIIPFECVLRCLLAAGTEPTVIDSRADSLLTFILESRQTEAVQMLIGTRFVVQFESVQSLAQSHPQGAYNTRSSRPGRKME